MFLSETDYNTLITDEDRDFVSQASDDNRTAAEGMAIDQMSSFLRGQFDVAAIFELEEMPEPDTRPKAIVMYCMDITLYHLHAVIPGRYMPEIRRIRYEDALAWLRDVAKGLIDPGLPLITDPEGEEIHPIRFGSQPKQRWNW